MKSVHTSSLHPPSHRVSQTFRVLLSPYLSLQNHRGLIPSTNPTLSHGFMSDLKILLLMNRLCIPPIRTRYSPRIQLPVQRRMRPLIWRQRNDRVLIRPLSYAPILLLKPPVPARRPGSTSYQSGTLAFEGLREALSPVSVPLVVRGPDSARWEKPFLS